MLFAGTLRFKNQQNTMRQMLFYGTVSHTMIPTQNSKTQKCVLEIAQNVSGKHVSATEPHSKFDKQSIFQSTAELSYRTLPNENLIHLKFNIYMKFGLKFQISNLKNIQFILTDRKLKIKKIKLCHMLSSSSQHSPEF